VLYRNLTALDALYTARVQNGNDISPKQTAEALCGPKTRAEVTAQWNPVANRQAYFTNIFLVVVP